MDLLGARFGQLMKILHLLVRMIPIGNPWLIFCLIHLKISDVGPIGKSSDVYIPFSIYDMIASCPVTASVAATCICKRIAYLLPTDFSFSFAYHTYLSVSDISEVRIEGLETVDYLDNLCHKERFTEQGDAITFESEVDQVYLNTPNVVDVLDHKRKRTYIIRKEGLPDVVVWNPWEKKSKPMADFGDGEYKQMLCVNGAAIEKHVTLKPGEEWTGRLELLIVASTLSTEHIDLQTSNGF
ncbi:putative glucose-6-phosphate 1-epimerase [Hibiscus syriacus]|uniref:putative glucose-6-phosphate 1-epimerase n=1 Tax=Hibiscus syriacus TaxID=106335 RepID=UPI0019226F10|nr:putative glucose-6-phosphate 1-epimerase [Hibiscus syriacus]